MEETKKQTFTVAYFTPGALASMKIRVIAKTSNSIKKLSDLGRLQ